MEQWDSPRWDRAFATQHRDVTFLPSSPRAEWMESRFPRGKMGFSPAWAALGRLPEVSGSSPPAPGLRGQSAAFPKVAGKPSVPSLSPLPGEVASPGTPRSHSTLGMLAPC